MPKEKVITERTVLTGEDAVNNEKENPSEPETKKPKDDYSEFIKGVSSEEAEQVTVRVTRTQPPLYKGVKIAGLIDEFAAPLDPIQIKEAYGGGKYSFTVIKSGKAMKTYSFEFPGDPIVELKREERDPLEDRKVYLRKKLELQQLEESLKDGEDQNPNYPPQGYIDPDEIAKKAARMTLKALQQREQSGPNQITQLIAALAPMMKPPDQTPIIQLLLTMMMQKPHEPRSAFEPKDIMGMMMPMMSEFVKGQSDIRKMEMTRVGEVQNMMMQKALNAMELGGAPPDEIDKIKKWIPLIQEAMGSVVTPLVQAFRKPPQVTQRPRLAKPPVENKPPVNDNPPPQENEPESPAPLLNNETQVETPPVDNKPEQIKAMESIKTEDVARSRTNQFLLAVEHEMKLQGDPDTVYDENFEQAFYILPKEIRDALIVAGDQLSILEAFSKYGDKDIIARITQHAMAEQSQGIWLIDFWGVIKQVDADRNAPEEDEPENNEPENDNGDEGEEVLA